MKDDGDDRKEKFWQLDIKDIMDNITAQLHCIKIDNFDKFFLTSIGIFELEYLSIKFLRRQKSFRETSKRLESLLKES